MNTLSRTRRLSWISQPQLTNGSREDQVPDRATLQEIREELVAPLVGADLPASWNRRPIMHAVGYGP